MNTDPESIRSLVEKGMSWPDIFREILSQFHPKARTYVHLTSELLGSCKLDPELMNQLQRWSYWFGEEGYDDHELERILEGKITLKDQADLTLPSQKP